MAMNLVWFVLAHPVYKKGGQATNTEIDLIFLAIDLKHRYVSLAVNLITRWVSPYTLSLHRTTHGDTAAEMHINIK